MFNKVIMMGRIVTDLELKTTPNGVSVLSFRIAVDRRYQNKGEDRKSDFFNVTAWRNEAEFISKYFGKGRMILIEGELQTREYQDKNGNTVRVTEIIVDRSTFTGEKANASANTGSNYGGGSGNNSPYQNYPGNASESHPANASNTEPTVSKGSTDDFKEVAEDDDDGYPF